jgi:motility quorum-sensing regulator/GCU-specific mRNA interferase toxin
VQTLRRAPPVGVLYVKFTADLVTEFLLLSFKEKDNG